VKQRHAKQRQAENDKFYVLRDDQFGFTVKQARGSLASNACVAMSSFGSLTDIVAVVEFVR
jgi:hypothetical protein